MALEASADRALVRLAVLRGGRLWRDHAGAVVAWFARQGDVVFLRWLAEDAVHGDLAIAWLAESEGRRTVDRAPLWTARGDEDTRRALIGGFYRGREAPTAQWSPSDEDVERSRGWRRWPLPHLEEDGLICCTVCGESLWGGPCSWCGTDPEQEPASALMLRDLLAERELCETCGIDVTSLLEPIRCPGCGEERIPL